jgi:hypothetical protein
VILVLQKNWKELIKPQKLDLEPGDDAKREATVVAEPLVRPCWPGLLSNLALSLIERRALFRNRSVPSRRESLALGPR